MEHIKHRTQDGPAKAGERKNESWKKGKRLDNKERRNDASLGELELKIRMEVGLIENKEERKDAEKRNFKMVGNDTKGQSRLVDGLNMKSGYGNITSEETLKKDIKEANVMKLPAKEESVSQLDVSDYLVLLKALRITLPKGVLNPEVIKLSHNADIIQKAQDIVKDLESFKLQFNSIPRLGCREIKNSLALKNNGKVLEMTLMIFFEKSKNSDKALRAKWKENTSNTVCGFSFRHKYKTIAISTPAMYATTQTRSWKHLEVGDNLANVCEGVTVNIHDIENTQYRDESALWTTSSSPEKFGKFFQNQADEIECLKFFHELGEMGNNLKVRYTRNTKLDFGFLSGRLDFLADITDSTVNGNAREGERDKIVIECKGTTGDMIGKLFTKPKSDSRRAQLNETHEYCYQVQAYMYILNKSAKQMQGFTSDRAVMVIRHYHKNAQEPRDFYWSFLEKNETVQEKIDELCAFCQEEVLACFLAVLNLIFQLETK